MLAKFWLHRIAPCGPLKFGRIAQGRNRGVRLFVGFISLVVSLAANSVRTIYVDGQNVYVGTSSGLSISNNGGQTFVTRTTTDGLGADTVNGVWASGLNLYVATEGGLSISNNGGTTFVNNDFGRTGNSQFSYGVSVNGQNVYVGTFVGLRVSTDGGQTFSLKTSTDFGVGTGDAFVRDVQAVGSTVYAALFYLSCTSRRFVRHHWTPLVRCLLTNSKWTRISMHLTNLRQRYSGGSPKSWSHR